MELAKNQGRIEGILTIKDPEEKKDYNEIWHAGYYNGLEQTSGHEEMQRLVAE